MVKLLSLNVKGSNSPIKRKLILTELKKQHADIALLQETHHANDEVWRLRDRNYPYYFYASNRKKKAGVAILFNKTSTFQLRRKEVDPNGRYIILEGTLEGVQIVIANLYAPNVRQIHFLQKVLNKVASYQNQKVILGGDFNMALSQLRDTMRPHSTLPNKEATLCSQNFRKLIRKALLLDIWRIKHPTQKQYTFYSHPHKTFSRIDYFLISPKLKIGPQINSDHDLIHIDIRIPDLPSRQWT
uniref:exodeoxyribonuclease III n=1 Tax=Xenopus tropicalis TaxID=8364 RepID=A0A803JWG6_XENTR